MSTLYHLVSDQLQDAGSTAAAARLAGPDQLRELCHEVARTGSALRPLTLSQRRLLSLQGKDPANQAQATSGIIRLLKLRPDIGAAAQVDPDELAAAAEKDEAYDLLASNVEKVEGAVEDGILACQAAQRDGADRLVAAIKQRLAELADDPVGQAELLAHLGALDFNARLIEEREGKRRRRSERREEDAATASQDTRAQADGEAAVAGLLGQTRGKRG